MEMKRYASWDVFPSSELKAYLAACDVFCFPSITKNEAFGIALAEAMAFAKPSVTFTIKGSGVNYVSLNGVTGIEVANGDVEAYAAAIRTLKEDAALREKFGRGGIPPRTGALYGEGLSTAMCVHSSGLAGGEAVK